MNLSILLCAVTLTGVSAQNPEFKGFFVQARIVADDTTRVGSFGVVDADNSRLSSCAVSTVCLATCDKIGIDQQL